MIRFCLLDIDEKWCSENHPRKCGNPSLLKSILIFAVTIACRIIKNTKNKIEMQISLESIHLQNLNNKLKWQTFSRCPFFIVKAKKSIPIAPVFDPFLSHFQQNFTWITLEINYQKYPSLKKNKLNIKGVYMSFCLTQSIIETNTSLTFTLMVKKFATKAFPNRSIKFFV